MEEGILFRSELRSAHVARTALLVVLIAIVFKCAWIGDDAYISLRTVENLAEGRGLVWNDGERVQVFTHPLWLLFVTGVRLVVGDGYWSLVVASLIVTAGAGAVVVWLLASSPLMAAFAVGVLVLGKWWVDFATSGLENPLLFLLAALFVHAWGSGASREPGDDRRGEEQLLVMVLLTSLAALTRADSLLLFGPPLAMRIPGLGRRAWRPLLLGMAPLILWEIFSVVWFGFPVANTAYAKLNTGLPASLLIGQGWQYLLYSIQIDPLLGVTLVAGVVFILRRPRTDWPFLVGLGLYLGYVVWIGGCFMGGRFLTLPFFIIVCLLARRPLPGPRGKMALAFLLFLALFVPRNPVTSSLSYDYVGGRAGIVDERGYYFPTTGAWHRLDGEFEEHTWILQGRRDRIRAESRGQSGFRVIDNIGFYGMEAGPQIYVVGPYALASPFLARLPSIPPSSNRKGWRIGHFRRDFPRGFEESIASDGNRLTDPWLRDLYDDTQLVTKGPLFTLERWKAIWRLNTGHHREVFRSPGP